MRKLPAIIARFLAALACLVLSACFDVSEELWIHRDGSGRAELRYTVPDSALRLGGGEEALANKIRELIATQPELRLDGVSVTAADDVAVIAVNVSTDSMLSLLDLKKTESFNDLPSSAGDLAGSFDIRLRGLDIDFSRTIDVGRALGLASLAVGIDDRKNRRLRYVIHLPRAAKESNATTVEDNGRTLKWEATLGEAIRKPVITRFRATMPVPWYAYVALVLLVIGSGWIALRWRRPRPPGLS